MLPFEHRMQTLVSPDMVSYISAIRSCGAGDWSWVTCAGDEQLHKGAVEEKGREDGDDYDVENIVLSTTMFSLFCSLRFDV